jgi:lipopolysaccharide/colanic/teichoic acid biosynthesis glycosyltransferase
MTNEFLAKERFYWLKVILDGIFLAIAFFAVYWLRRGNLLIDERFREFLPVLFLTWFLVTILSKKFKILKKQDYFSRLQPYWGAAIIFVSLLMLLLYVMGWIYLSRFIIFGSIGMYFVMESLYLAFHLLFLRRRDPGRPIPFAVFFFLIEITALVAVFYSIYFSKRDTFRLEEKYQLALMGMFFAWLLISLLVHRFKVKTDSGFWKAFIPFWQSEALILGLISFSIFVATRGSMSRLIIFGSIAAFALLENLVVLAYYGVFQFKVAEEDPAELLADELAHPQVATEIAAEDIEEIVKEKYRFQEKDDSQEILKNKIERLFLNKFQDVYDFIKQYVDLSHFDLLSSVYLFAADIFNIDIFEDDSLSLFFNFEKVNNFRYVNRVLIALNKKIKKGGVFIGCFESYDQRRQRIFSKFHRWFARIFYVVDFIYKRIMPKLPFLKRIYFFFSRGKKRVFSRTEVLGRLYYCGFEVIGMRPINNIDYFIAKKTREPRSDPRPSYGPVFRQRRLGKSGKIIHIYKLRTMHPFAEYLHQYIFDKHQLEESGKIKGDFRITSWGRFFRKTWLDELPMLVNWLKRDIKLVGVRPLSETFFKTYPEDLKIERLEFKPGLIPPFYADMPSGIEEVWDSERMYLSKYKKHPFFTDFIYFFKALNNILFHHAKSS